MMLPFLFLIDKNCHPKLSKVYLTPLPVQETLDLHDSLPWPPRWGSGAPPRCFHHFLYFPLVID